MFVGLEAVFRRQLELEGRLHAYGLRVLLVVLVLLSYHDILRILAGRSLDMFGAR